jgi:hypothetical protein
MLHAGRIKGHDHVAGAPSMGNAPAGAGGKNPVSPKKPGF